MMGKWTLQTTTDDAAIAGEAGDALVMVNGALARATDEEITNAEVFIRIAAQRVRLAAMPGRLLVNGRGASGGIAMLDGRGAHMIRVGQHAIIIRPVTFTVSACSGEHGGKCGISREPLRAGDTTVSCACGVVMLAGYARELGDHCPRCGRGGLAQVEVRR